MYKIIEDFIPKDGYKRSGLSLDWEYITIHNNANLKSTAENERDFLTSKSNISYLDKDGKKIYIQTSWHDVIREETIIIAIPHNEVAWACGDGVNGTGNRKSISIEICESGNFELNVRTSQKYVAKLLHEKGFGVDRVKKHYDWSGKNCPRILIPNWKEYITGIQKELNILNNENIIKNDKTKHWAYTNFVSLNKKGFNVSEMRFNDKITRGEIFALLDKITDKL